MKGLHTRVLSRGIQSSQDSFETIDAGDITQYWSVSNPIFSSLQLFLLKTTRASLTTKPHSA